MLGGFGVWYLGSRVCTMSKSGVPFFWGGRSCEQTSGTQGGEGLGFRVHTGASAGSEC